MLTWLAAAVAFSLSMIVFSTIVSALTEFVHRLFHMRESGLRRMIEQLYERHLAPQIIGSAGSKESAREFSDALTRNLAFGVRERNKALALFGHWYAPRRLQSLDWLEFVRRVAETPVGAALKERAEPEIEHAVNDLAVRFERFGADASAYFQERARAISITLAMVVALALNVDAVRLFSTFLTDRALTEGVIASADKIVAEYQKQGSPPPAELEGAAKRLGDTLNSPLLAGLPIGFGVYPWCMADGETQRDSRCAKSLCESPGAALAWFLSVLMAGFLIGLGGPFWFKAYTKLASILSAARSAEKRGDEEDESREPTDSPAGAPPPGMRATPLEAFAAALPEPMAARARPLLARDGQKLR